MNYFILWYWLDWTKNCTKQEKCVAAPHLSLKCDLLEQYTTWPFIINFLNKWMDSDISGGDWSLLIPCARWKAVWCAGRRFPENAASREGTCCVHGARCENTGEGVAVVNINGPGVFVCVLKSSLHPVNTRWFIMKSLFWIISPDQQRTRISHAPLTTALAADLALIKI